MISHTPGGNKGILEVTEDNDLLEFFAVYE
jgi:hypothetical protein